MSDSKHRKSTNTAQTPATRAATSAAGKLASFAASNTSNPPTSTKELTTPEEPANAVPITMDQLSTEFAKQRTSLRDDISSLIQEAIKPLQATLDSLQTAVSSFQKRLTSVESVAGDNFERIAAAESTITELRTQNRSLLDRLDDLENRSRRTNLRIINIPEGSEDGEDPVKFMSKFLMKVTGPDVFTAPPELERAHRTPTSRTGHGKFPRTFLVCFSKFQQKEAVLRWARNHELKYQEATIRIYQDVSTALAKKRAAFNGVKRALYQKNVKFQLLYPARLRVMYRDDVLTFDSPDEAQKFYDEKFSEK